MNLDRLLLVMSLTATILMGIFLTLSPYVAQAGGVVGPPCDDAALRAALAGGGAVTFNCGGPKTIVVVSVNTITQTTTIDGGGVITLAAEFTRLFSVTSGVTLTLRNIILADAMSFGSDGGAISSAGTLIVENGTFQNNQTDSAHSGGAVFSTGPVKISNSRFISNTGGSAGAMFVNFGNARAQVTNSTFSQNQAINSLVGRGGALWVGTGANLTVVDSQFLTNAAVFGGGALFVTQGGTATLSTQNVLNGVGFLANGGVIATSLKGGAIYSEGALRVDGVRFAENGFLINNRVDDGGAIYNAGGALDVLNSIFDTNLANTHGGAIAQQQGATLITGSVFFHNEAIFGGAIDALTGGELTINDSQFRSNRADINGGAMSIGIHALVLRSTFSNNSTADPHIGGGGAIRTLSAATSHLELYQSALFGNESGNDGGALYLAGGDASLTNVTLSGNSAVNSGGGLFMTNTVTAELRNVTIAGNTADSDVNGVGDGGGIRIFTGTFEISNSIIAGNVDLSPQLRHNDCSGLIQSFGHNLNQDSFGCAIGGATLEDLFGKDPLLAPLADNGGPTKTRALLPGSPAIDTGSPVAQTDHDLRPCADVDQRGVRRPIGRYCDIGAYEAPLWLFLPFVWR